MALDLNDKTANGNNLTNSGAAEYTSDFPFAGKSEAIALVRSESDYLRAADSATLSLTGDLSLEAWVKFDTTPSSGQLYDVLAKWNGSSLLGKSFYFLVYNNSGTIQLWFIKSPEGLTEHDVHVDWTPSTNTWYQLAITKSSSTVKFYVDAVQQGTDQTLTNATIADTATVFQIGANEYPDGTANPFDGKMTEIRVWSSVRTQSEINSKKNTELTGSETGLNAYWPFETPVPTTTNHNKLPLMGVG